MSTTSSPPIAYIMKRYPRLSETFILNEIAVMEGLGAGLELFSLLPPEPPPHHPLVREIKAGLHHLPLLAWVVKLKGMPDITLANAATAAGALAKWA